MNNNKSHLEWWNKNLNKDNIYNQFSSWLEQSDSDSRKTLYEFIKNNNISSCLEFGPGIFIDYNSFFKNEKIDYHSVEITNKIIDLANKNNISCEYGSIEGTNLPENSYELVYTRHVFEHLDYYDDALKEMLRLASKYVVVIFWLISQGDEDNIEYVEIEDLYHNSYSKEKISQKLKEKNLDFEWIKCKTDTLLIIKK